MRRSDNHRHTILSRAVVATAATLLAACQMPLPSAWSAEIMLEDGRILKGDLAEVSSLAETPQPPTAAGMGPARLIVLVDDHLRRTFVYRRQIREVRQADLNPTVEEKFLIRQRALQAGPAVKSVGPVARIEPFDEFGRRIFTFNTLQGPIDVIQGITEITPEWTKVEGISHIWDMRIATSSIPPDVLHKVLMKQIDASNPEHLKKVARFYLQSERYGEARQALEMLVKAFPDRPELKEELAPTIRSLRQLGAQRLLQELQLRRDAGQHRMVLAKLQTFPSEDVAGEILQAVREMVETYGATQTQGQQCLEQLDAVCAGVKKPEIREQIETIRQEIRRELNINTFARMAAFRQNVGDPELTPEEKTALAASGWLIGSDSATVNLPVAMSLYRVRNLVREYMAEPVKVNRARLLAKLGSEEGAAPRLVAALIAHMKPPLPVPEPMAEDKPGLFSLQVDVMPGEPPARCLVQLPPEYDPYRRYPTIVTLHGAGATAEHQLDWWAGGWAKGGWRMGQATRRGYIVIAPEWADEHQRSYGYSAREHGIVLGALRDACRRFAVDTDRVFLSGHSIGGDAAWDIGLAHPDLWAGVIPIVAQSDRYCQHYWENAKYVPFYFIAGELDGNKLTQNAADLDRYFAPGYNCTVVEYLGRGHEHFSDDILRLFDWMGRFRRDFFPEQFTCATMRRWDNFFWWVELSGMPPRAVVEPVDWPPPRNTQAMKVTARLTKNNGIYITPGASQVSVWISPEMIDFEKRAYVVVNGRRLNSRNPFLQPDLETLLEDVRTRGDRQHPFWAVVEAQTGRRGW